MFRNNIYKKAFLFYYKKSIEVNKNIKIKKLTHFIRNNIFLDLETIISLLIVFITGLISKFLCRNIDFSKVNTDNLKKEFVKFIKSGNMHNNINVAYSVVSSLDLNYKKYFLDYFYNLKKILNRDFKLLTDENNLENNWSDDIKFLFRNYLFIVIFNKINFDLKLDIINMSVNDLINEFENFIKSKNLEEFIKTDLELTWNEYIELIKMSIDVNSNKIFKKFKKSKYYPKFVELLNNSEDHDELINFFVKIEEELVELLK